MNTEDYNNIKIIYFTCTGNTCRSPMAEAIAKHEAKKRNLNLQIASRRNTIDEKVCYSIFSKISDYSRFSIINHLDDEDFCNKHEPKSMTRQELLEADLVLTMTVAQRDSLRKHQEAYLKTGLPKTYTLTEFAGLSQLDIEDPAAYDHFIFEKTYLEISFAISLIFEERFRHISQKNTK
jgi:protein-tyrosine-phosphatase